MLALPQHASDGSSELTLAVLGCGKQIYHLKKRAIHNPRLSH